MSIFTGVGNASATVLGNTIYVAGGIYGIKSSCSYNKIQSYKVDIGQWSILTTCPHPGSSDIISNCKITNFSRIKRQPLVIVHTERPI